MMKNRKDGDFMDLIITLAAAFVLIVIIGIIWKAGDD